ncbi:hypothetical protein EXIGLDRAFT_480015 [Exidia glandulosa HHB12029]|uniref:Uncharacterized protein n=1 Tax=Exidia glandulosa HHB12029 TaxID=1314781 RepID=A0A165JSC0_EXIGL|nr:hypothetical protein EXIGLDRAFT_480015 [Exidia glandulosa HHB12029]
MRRATKRIPPRAGSSPKAFGLDYRLALARTLANSASNLARSFISTSVYCAAETCRVGFGLRGPWVSSEYGREEDEGARFKGARDEDVGGARAVEVGDTVREVDGVRGTHGAALPARKIEIGGAGREVVLPAVDGPALPSRTARELDDARVNAPQLPRRVCARGVRPVFAYASRSSTRSIRQSYRTEDESCMQVQYVDIAVLASGFGSSCSCMWSWVCSQVQNGSVHPSYTSRRG